MAVVATAGASDILRLRRRGLSYRAIAAYLDRKGVKPPRAAAWSAMSVRNVYMRVDNDSSFTRQ